MESGELCEVVRNVTIDLPHPISPKGRGYLYIASTTSAPNNDRSIDRSSVLTFHVLFKAAGLGVRLGGAQCTADEMV